MESGAERNKSVWPLRGLVLGVALIAGLGALVFSGDDEQPESTSTSTARIATEQNLAEMGGEAGHPVYWAGEMEGADLAATKAEDGSIQVTYVEEGADPESSAIAFPTVVTYPMPDPEGALDLYAARPDSIVRRSDDGRKVVSSKETPTSAYFVSPDDSVQVEVYDPAPGRALAAALGGRVQPAG